MWPKVCWMVCMSMWDRLIWSLVHAPKQTPQFCQLKRKRNLLVLWAHPEWEWDISCSTLGTSHHYRHGLSHRSLLHVWKEVPVWYSWCHLWGTLVCSREFGLQSTWHGSQCGILMPSQLWSLWSSWNSRDVQSEDSTMVVEVYQKFIKMRKAVDSWADDMVYFRGYGNTACWIFIRSIRGEGEGGSVWSHGMMWTPLLNFCNAKCIVM